jgi:hypothetical protein
MGKTLRFKDVVMSDSFGVSSPDSFFPDERENCCYEVIMGTLPSSEMESSLYF